MRREKLPARSLPEGVITAMFTDIVDSTRIKDLVEGETSARRDARYRQIIKDPHDAIVLTCARQSAGYIVNPTGDGFCIAFIDAEEAVLCALRIQHQLETSHIDTPIGPLQIRIGLHTGVASPSGGDYIASTVDKTARVQSLAGKGQVFVSHQTQVMVFDRMHGVRFEARGVFDLKGLQAEQLYQTVAMPELDLSQVSNAVGEAAQPAQFAIVGRKTFKPVLVLGSLAAICLAGLIWVLSPAGFQGGSPKASISDASSGGGDINKANSFSSTEVPGHSLPALQSTEMLPAGSNWEGNFHFLPPMKNYDGSVSMQITKRNGSNFEGVYSSENNSYQWHIEGTIQRGHVHWEFINLIKKPKNKTEDAIGKAYGEAVVKGDRLTGLFLNKSMPQEKASLDLRLTKPGEN